MGWRSFVAWLLLASAAGCMTVPTRYRTAARVYSPAVEAVAVRGYERTEFYPTSTASAALIAPQLGIYAAGGGVSGEYRIESDAGLFRQFFEDTRCARRVTLTAGDSPVTIEGQATAEERIEGENILINVLLFVPSFLGVPLHDDAYGLATARLYRDGEFVTAAHAEARLGYWTPIYTVLQNRGRAFALARGMALRAAADDLAAQICGRP